MKAKLSPLPARTNLTDRECTKIIGGLIGGLCALADVETVQAAIQWWAETPEAWAVLIQAQTQMGGPQ